MQPSLLYGVRRSGLEARAAPRGVSLVIGLSQRPPIETWEAPERRPSVAAQRRPSDARAPQERRPSGAERPSRTQGGARGT